MTRELAAGDLRPVGGRPPFEVGDHEVVRARAKLFDRLSCGDDVSKTMPPRAGAIARTRYSPACRHDCGG
jgi:hypothetical protein